MSFKISMKTLFIKFLPLALLSGLSRRLTAALFIGPRGFKLDNEGLDMAIAAIKKTPLSIFLRPFELLEKLYLANKLEASQLFNEEIANFTEESYIAIINRYLTLNPERARMIWNWTSLDRQLHILLNSHFLSAKISNLGDVIANEPLIKTVWDANTPFKKGERQRAKNLIRRMYPHLDLT